jgi:CelD/BcsL family acetyltransferase involved in cellulose biosynthesis
MVSRKILSKDFGAFGKFEQWFIQPCMKEFNELGELLLLEKLDRMRPLTNHEFITQEFADDWRCLLELQLAHDIGNTYEWNKCWWETYSNFGVAKKEFFILADENQGRTSGIWPLFIRRRYGMKIVHWIGQADGMLTDYMGPVFPEGMKDKRVRALLDFLAYNNVLWDIVDFRAPAWSGLIDSLIKNLVLYGEGFGFSWQVRVPDHAVAVDLPDDFEKYLGCLGKRTRTDIRQYLRAANQNHAKLEIYRGDTISERIPALFELSTANWMVFRDNGSKRFLLEVAEALAAGKENVFLGVLAYEDRAIGAVLGFEHDRVCYLHPAGVLRQQVAGMSPGMTMYAMLVSSLIERKFKRLDLSPGLEEYKLRLGGHVEPVYQFLLWHKKSKIKRWRLFDWARRTTGNPLSYFTRNVDNTKAPQTDRR